MVRNTLGTRAAVFLFDDGQEVDIPGSFLTPVPPNKNDKVLSANSKPPSLTGC